MWQERKFAGGANQISEGMARDLGDRVKLGRAVYSIDQTGDLVEVRTVNEEIYKVRMCTKNSAWLCPIWHGLLAYCLQHIMKYIVYTNNQNIAWKRKKLLHWPDRNVRSSQVHCIVVCIFPVQVANHTPYSVHKCPTLKYVSPFMCVILVDCYQ